MPIRSPYTKIDRFPTRSSLVDRLEVYRATEGVLHIDLERLTIRGCNSQGAVAAPDFNAEAGIAFEELVD
jgi:hypothetical protein